MVSGVVISGLARSLWANPLVRALGIVVSFLFALWLFYLWAEDEGREEVEREIDQATTQETVRQLNVFRDVQDSEMGRAEVARRDYAAAMEELAQLRTQLASRPVSCDGVLFDVDDVERLRALRSPDRRDEP